MFFVVLRGPSWTKRKLRCSSRSFVALRGQKEVKVFFVALRGPSWTKRKLRCSSWSFAALRGQKKVFPPAHRGQTNQ